LAPLSSKLMFDAQDYDLLEIVDQIVRREKAEGELKSLFDPYLHPHGIKEMAAPKELRMAFASARLLDSLEAGGVEDRLNALRSLRDEVMTTAKSSLRKNTARVLLQIMKELIRSKDDQIRRLKLAHDFRTAASGKPRIIRAQLRFYHLLEMPEAWTQLSFDDHVHDANTKGRKSPTHLIMDAWIKGIRHLMVVHYNFVTPNAASELIQASKIMGINVEIGLQLPAYFHGRYVHLIWSPSGFSDSGDFLNFLAEPKMKSLMAEGWSVSEYQKKYVLRLLDEFNCTHLPLIPGAFNLELKPLEREEFLNYVGTGQASVLHLANFIHGRMVTAFERKKEHLREIFSTATPEKKESLSEEMKRLNFPDSEEIVERYLRPAKNPSIPHPHLHREGPDVPELLRISPNDLLDQFCRIRSGGHITLNLTDLTVEDVIEILYDCRGLITHLEIFNLKDYVDGRNIDIKEIFELQKALNEGNAVSLKRIIRTTIEKVETAKSATDRFKKILIEISIFRSYYKGTPLKTRVGTDSTGRSHRLHGMGLVAAQTLPWRAQKEIQKPAQRPRLRLPLQISADPRITFSPRVEGRIIPILQGFSLSAFRCFYKKENEDWVVRGHSFRPKGGNIVTLGGIQSDTATEFHSDFFKTNSQENIFSWKYLNSGVKNSLKVLAGFLPAFATFVLTKEWWLLAYFGAIIWFAITGLRNILQSVLGGGGFSRAPLLRWNDYVNWERIADSLLYTGFSVPLLDFLVKTIILDQGLGIDIETHPVFLYSIMALANGIYISSHNMFRGLPKEAVFGNFFRSILSIPLAIGFNSLIGAILIEARVPQVNLTLQIWAAVISKSASDCVAGVIEGLADRMQNLRMRAWDYTGKMSQFFEIYASLEIIFHDIDGKDLLYNPEELLLKLKEKDQNLEKGLIINALDFLYFWMYKPRARVYFQSLLRSLSPEEREILIRSQCILLQQREISLLLINGILGKNFSKALSFFLDRSGEYLEAIKLLSDQKFIKEYSIDRSLVGNNLPAHENEALASGSRN